MFFSRLSYNADTNGEDTSSFSSEEEKEGDVAPPVNGLSPKPKWTSRPHSKAPPSSDRKADEDDEEEEGSRLPTIFFSHTIEPKKVRVIKKTSNNNLLFKKTFLLILQFNPVLSTFSLPAVSFFCFR